MTVPILSVDNLHTHFFTRDGVVRAIDSLSLTVQAGEVLGIVGESGCGKSVTALSIMRLIPPRSGRIVQGSVRFEGRDLATLDDEQMRAIRGNQIAMVFQEPMTSLNPVHTVGAQIAEAVRIHQGRSGAAALARAVEMLALEPERRAHEYPHQLSGGMRQRAMIAMALACRPALLIADEPTTALDVTIQSQILAEVQALAADTGTALIWVTHDLAVIAGLADRIAVMYAGRIVEQGPVDAVLNAPLHPYTRGLIGSVPSHAQRGAALTQIPGMAPSLTHLPPGCAFAPRCARADALCDAMPELAEIAPAHAARCWHPYVEAGAAA